MPGKKLTIVSRAEGGHCRAGRKWSNEPTVVSESDFDAKQLAQMRADKRLIIMVGELQTEASAEAKAENLKDELEEKSTAAQRAAGEKARRREQR